MKAPTSTYRLQIRKSLTLADAASLTGYLQDLGVDWLYLSPILQAERDSDHGYDVTDASRIDDSRGGAEGLKALSEAARAAGMGLMVDIVPNHQGVATPADNPWYWSLLKEGRASRYAEAFDIDWDAADGKIRLPVLGDGDDELHRLTIVDDRLCYFEHCFPIAEGTNDDGADPITVHDRQHYELVSWRRADSELNYRRFFGVNTLAGVRVEVPWVFDESHAEIKRWFDEDLVDGLRIDHPDGLADPKGYLDRLQELTGGAYVLVEKILEPGEELPSGWACQGTTGYDALAEVDRLLVDPRGRETLTELTSITTFTYMIHNTKRAIADGILRSEVLRLARLVPADAGVDFDTAADAIAELLACFPVYRSYLPEGGEHLEQAAESARMHRPDLAETVDILLPLLAAPEREFAVRFQQTSGMVMAKGVEDTAFYRYTRLTSLNEVGGDPSIFALEPYEFHQRMRRRQESQPLSMTTLSTHDTKRSEDTRARIHVLSEAADIWAQTFGELCSLAPIDDAPLADLIWQAIVGAWPLSPDRAHAYAEKAAREAGNSTSWTEPNEAFETVMHAAVDAAFNNPEVTRVIERLVDVLRLPGWTNSLSAKLIQLTMPGVPDVYQGSEFWEDSLVDPDNRRRVDFAAREEALQQIDAGLIPPIGPDGEAKLLVTSRALRLRRDHPELFTRYVPLTALGPAATHVVAFDRGGAITVATRLPYGLQHGRGWADTSLELPGGEYRDVFTNRAVNTNETHRIRVADLLDIYPVALLQREKGTGHEQPI